MRSQILSTQNNEKTKKKSGNIEINKIVIFFAIILIIFSISCIGMGTYAIVQNNDIIGYKKPEVDMQKQDDKLAIIANSTRVIDRIVYTWNDDSNEEVIDGNGQTNIEKVIDLPVGNNTIKLTIYDINGKKTIYEKNYEVESKAPQLSIEPSNGKLKVIAKDNEKMSYITYRWDEEEETKVDATEASAAQIEQEIEIPRGQHTLTVIAVNSRNLSTEKNQEVKGVTKPIISVVQDADNFKYAILSISDEEAIKNVLIDLNGKKYQIDLSEYKEKSIQYKLELQQGENIIKITSTNFDGAQGIFEGACTYNP